MKNSEATVFVFIASIIIGILISLNINFDKKYDRVFLNSKQYQDAYNSKNKLRSDINNLDEQYKTLYSKIEKYESGDKSKYTVLKEMEDEINKNKIILGEVAVEGEGINITLNDASTEFMNEDFDYQIKIIHNTDVLKVINDLRNAGAEAISINDQRIIDRSEIYCNGPFLKVNGIKIVAPFHISAIGKKEGLKNYMLLDGNHLKELIYRQIDVVVEENDKIKIPSYDYEIKTEYLVTK